MILTATKFLNIFSAIWLTMGIPLQFKEFAFLAESTDPVLKILYYVVLFSVVGLWVAKQWYNFIKKVRDDNKQRKK